MNSSIKRVVASIFVSLLAAASSLATPIAFSGHIVSSALADGPLGTTDAAQIVGPSTGTTNTAFDQIASTSSFSFQNTPNGLEFSVFNSLQTQFEYPNSEAHISMLITFTLSENYFYSFTGSHIGSGAPQAVTDAVIYDFGNSTDIFRDSDYTRGGEPFSHAIDGVMNGNTPNIPLVGSNTGILSPGTYDVVAAYELLSRIGAANGSSAGNWRFTLTSVASTVPDDASVALLFGPILIALLAFARSKKSN
jgi:hypothetical protein